MIFDSDINVGDLVVVNGSYGMSIGIVKSNALVTTIHTNYTNNGTYTRLSGTVTYYPVSDYNRDRIANNKKLSSTYTTGYNMVNKVLKINDSILRDEEKKIVDEIRNRIKGI